MQQCSSAPLQMMCGKLLGPLMLLFLSRRTSGILELPACHEGVRDRESRNACAQTHTVIEFLATTLGQASCDLEQAKPELRWLCIPPNRLTGCRPVGGCVADSYITCILVTGSTRTRDACANVAVATSMRGTA
ncbi:uncharacterized protein F5Z01DRAFT_480406 [Emericellopsis atlantica]|uniref:Secreted protein n=1 Tax=Emericellopsis atlantica TaxID=2614577 RepID=A0A9P7ZR16_9HYPO|nr:uncharacterized protein F5Z01DRAFT_480406 [Emericellopsis atlantica]KAG9256630.1 hypothetical protein F5Z01DRAFT_480406 [Emericellopsis atlantica]